MGYLSPWLQTATTRAGQCFACAACCSFASLTPTPVDTTNYAKFQTSNPVVRKLIDGFYGHIRELIAARRPGSLLDAGCGEGETLLRISDLLSGEIAGVDLNPDSVEFARERVPTADLSVGDITALPFEDGQFETVLCLEVLEHLTDPAAAIDELSRVCSRDLVISVPYEPWFRLGSLARGKYLRGWGNHPEHINHWNPSSIREILPESKVETVQIIKSMPWLIVHCRPADSAGGPAQSQEPRS